MLAMRERCYEAETVVLWGGCGPGAASLLNGSLLRGPTQARITTAIQQFDNSGMVWC